MNLLSRIILFMIQALLHYQYLSGVSGSKGLTDELHPWRLQGPPAYTEFTDQDALMSQHQQCQAKHKNFVYQPGLMGDEEAATLDGQFFEFARLLDNKRDGTTITLYRSDFWMRQAHVLEDRRVTMTDTGILFTNYSKTELTFDEWLEFVSELCVEKDLNEDQVKDALTNCGLPGQTPVIVPQYRDFFLTYKPKDKMAGM